MGSSFGAGMRDRGRRIDSELASREASWTVLDLFSGAGGMSAGFSRHQAFCVIGAVDYEVSKPSYGPRSLECNKTYVRNIGVRPFSENLAELEPSQLREKLGDRHGKRWNGSLDVLISCAPCTGFSRVSGKNHVRDDPRNALVRRTTAFVKEFEPRVFLMENTRELIMGRFNNHYGALRRDLERHGYTVSGSIHFLDAFGLPQRRERALVMAVRNGLQLHTLEELWKGFRVRPEATTVRRAIWHLPPIAAGERHADDPMHEAPSFASPTSYDRMKAIPRDGGSWGMLVGHDQEERLLTPSMKRIAAAKKWGSHPDIYGRLWWDRPAVTIKRECANQGNGRYSHPEQNRLLSVREMAILQGFPLDYRFDGGLSNRYRHIGDAVPPLISYQLAHLAAWSLGGDRPKLRDVLLPDTHLDPKDIVKAPAPEQRQLALA